MRDAVSFRVQERLWVLNILKNLDKEK